MKGFLAVCAAIVLAGPAMGQAADLQQLLSGKDVPNSMKLIQLNADWKRVTIRTTDNAGGGLGDMMSQLMQAGMMSEANKNKSKDDAMGAMLGMSMLGGLFGGGDKEPVYYTLGQTVTIGGETFLVAYQREQTAPNFMQMAMEASAGGKEPDMTKLASQNKLTADSPLSLALINMKSVSTLSKIRPFNMAQEIAESEKAGNGLMDLIMQPAVKAAEPAKPVVTAPAANKKPAAKPGSR